jgi:hypothetical protein
MGAAAVREEADEVSDTEDRYGLRARKKRLKYMRTQNLPSIK